MDVPAPAAMSGRLARTIWAGTGLLCVGLGGAGIVVPGLPTTVFFIAAAWCFSRSSPRLERWVLGLPKIGPMVLDHRAGLGMPRRAKVVATVLLAAAVGVSALLVIDHMLVATIVAAAGLVGLAVIWWRVPTRENVVTAAPRPAIELAERGAE